MIRCKDLGLIKIKRRHKKYENEKKVDSWLVVERVDRIGQDVGQLLRPPWEILSPTTPMMMMTTRMIKVFREKATEQVLGISFLLSTSPTMTTD